MIDFWTPVSCCRHLVTCSDAGVAIGKMLLLLLIYRGLRCARFRLCIDNTDEDCSVDSLVDTLVETHRKALVMK